MNRQGPRRSGGAPPRHRNAGPRGGRAGGRGSSSHRDSGQGRRRSGETQGSSGRAFGRGHPGRGASGRGASGGRTFGRADGSTARGRADGSTARGRADGSTARGRADGSTARGRADGSTANKQPPIIKIEGFDPHGCGRGHLDDTTILIPGALPGEQVRFTEVHRSKEGILHGKLWSIRSASSLRIVPACRKFLLCGGCDFLHAAPELELQFKRERVAEALGRDLETIDPVIPSPHQLHYRAVAKFVIGPHGELGSYAPRSHRVIDMQGCKVHAPVIERVAEYIRKIVKDRKPNLTGARYLVLRAALPHEAVHVTMVMHKAGCRAEETLLSAFASLPEVAEVWLHVNSLDSDAIFDPNGHTQCLHRGRVAVGRVGNAEQHLASGAFAQINPAAAERLYQRVAELVEPEGAKVLDLYAGSGGISLTLAHRGAQRVLGVERNPNAVEAAKKAASLLSDRLEFITAPVEDLSALMNELEAFDPRASGGGFSTWVVNPPRKGLAPETIRALLELRPKRVIYVSCQPDRLARDIAELKTIYQLDTVSPVDMFPQTHHIETIARLTRQGSIT